MSPFLRCVPSTRVRAGSVGLVAATGLSLAAVALVATPGALGGMVLKGMTAVGHANILILWIAGAGFVVSLIASANAWRTTLECCGARLDVIHEGAGLRQGQGLRAVGRRGRCDGCGGSGSGPVIHSAARGGPECLAGLEGSIKLAAVSRLVGGERPLTTHELARAAAVDHRAGRRRAGRGGSWGDRRWSDRARLRPGC
jgi:hypothetical protein